MYIVLTTKGKRESVDYASVRVFNDKQEANDFIKAKESPVQEKYWTKCELVDQGKEVELSQPEWLDEQE
jgi:hypothetical protein